MAKKNKEQAVGDSEIPDHKEEKEIKTSVIFDTIKSLNLDDSVDNDSIKNEKEEKEEEIVKEEAKEDKKDDDKQQIDDDFDPSKVDETKFQGKTGETFKKFKESARKRDETIKQLTKEIEDLKLQKPTEHPDVQAIIKERDELKDKVDTELFFSSPQFNAKYVEPLKKSEEDVRKLIAVISDDDKRLVLPLLQQANDLISTPDSEERFNDVVDRIADEAFSATNGAKFKSKMADLYLKQQEYSAAFKEKSEAKKKIDSERSKNIDQSIEPAVSFITGSVSSFLQNNKAVVDLYETDETLKKQYNYKGEIENDTNEVKEGLAEFSRTGVVTRKLSDFLARGVLLRSREQEITVQSSIIRSQMDTLKKQNDKIAQLEKEVKELSSSESKGNRSTKSSEPTHKKGSSILAEAIRQARGE